jgi:hypothetical protein
MRQITKYAAADGAEFTSADACIAYEALAAEVAEIMATLRARPDDDADCNFSNGHGYLQHDPEMFYRARLSLLKLAQRYTTFRWIQESIDDPTVHPSWAGRIISEACPRPLYAAWARLSCVDDQFREWGQPFYANNPDKAPESRRLNPEQA